jgi:hypothetical protein
MSRRLLPEQAVVDSQVNNKLLGEVFGPAAVTGNRPKQGPDVEGIRGLAGRLPPLTSPRSSPATSAGLDPPPQPLPTDLLDADVGEFADKLLREEPRSAGW